MVELAGIPPRDLCRSAHPLLVIILSVSGHTKQRKAIRSTWLTTSPSDCSVEHLFVLRGHALSEELVEETQQQGDLLMVQGKEEYVMFEREVREF